MIIFYAVPRATILTALEKEVPSITPWLYFQHKLCHELVIPLEVTVLSNPNSSQSSLLHMNLHNMDLHKKQKK
jgi:hypothetical protein